MKDKKILIYGGTTEGRELAELLCASGFFCTVCVATEYGEMVMEELPLLTVRTGRMSAAEMRELAEKGMFFAVVDATHPFAVCVSENIIESLKGLSVPYLRLKRNTKGTTKNQEGIRWFWDADSCAKALMEMPGRILLTTGSRDLAVYCQAGLKERLYVRVLPGLQSIALCEKKGICGRQIIAMQGPFSAEMNEAIIREFEIDCLVTKESGNAGGFFEKIEAAQKLQIPVFVIGNPETEPEGYSLSDTLQKLYKLAGKSDEKRAGMYLSLIGMGMGNRKQLTMEALEALERAEVIFGAERLLKQIPGCKERYPYYMSEDILPKLEEIKDRLYSGKACLPEKKPFGQDDKVLKIAVLFSGDTGFYSGMEKFYEALEKKKKNWNCDMAVQIFPGISSMSYLASRAGISWSDAAVVSIHGRKADVLRAASEHKKTFVLVSGVEDMRKIGTQLSQLNNQNVTVLMGYQLSYPEEEIKRLTPAACMELKQEGLYCCLIENPNAAMTAVAHGRKDHDFIRDRVPMTKEEVREISICKLRLTKDAVLYDIGSGTGSVAVEAALLSKDISVYAIERKAEAAELIRRNCVKFGVSNVNVVEQEAPEGILDLPTPTHAFIGGSGGNIREILHTLYQKNPNLSVVMNAVTLETTGRMVELVKEIKIVQEEFVQVQVSRAKSAGRLHLMQAENPVTILSFQFTES